MRKISYILLAISVFFTMLGVTADILVWLHVLAKTEPQVVLHLSTWALIFAGFSGVVAAITNLELNKKK